MPDEKQTGLLRDILDSALTIRLYLDEVSREAFMACMEKQDAVLRRFEIIGEAASRLSPETQALFPSFAFSRHERNAQHHRSRLWRRGY